MASNLDLRNVQLQYVMPSDMKSNGDGSYSANKNGHESLSTYYVQEVQKAVQNGVITPDTAILALAVAPGESSYGNFLNVDTSSGATGAVQVLSSYYTGKSNYLGQWKDPFTGQMSLGYVTDGLGRTYTMDEFKDNPQAQLQAFQVLADSKRSMVYTSLKSKYPDFDPLSDTSSHDGVLDANRLMGETAGSYLGGGVGQDGLVIGGNPSRGSYKNAVQANAESIAKELGIPLSEVYKMRVNKTNAFTGNGKAFDVNKPGNGQKVILQNGKSITVKDSIYKGDSSSYSGGSGSGSSASNSDINNSNFINNVPSIENLSNISIDYADSVYRKKFTMIIVNLTARNVVNNYIQVELLPDNISENITANFADVPIPGRSESYVLYDSNANRDISFNLKLYDKLCFKPLGLFNTVNMLKALCYPDYSTDFVIPSYCYVKIGDIISFNGVCNSVSTTWQKPIVTDSNGKQFFSYAEVGISFKQISAIAPGVTDIIQKGGNI